MGESRNGSLRVSFDPKLKMEFRGAEVTSDAGLLAYRELEEALGLTKLAEVRLRDARTGMNVRHTLGALFRQSIFSRLAGHEDVNDAEHLRSDPAMRAIVGGRVGKHGAASRSEMARFDTEILSADENLRALQRLSAVSEATSGAAKWTRLSCYEFRANEVRLQLFVLAYLSATGRQLGEFFSAGLRCRVGWRIGLLRRCGRR